MCYNVRRDVPTCSKKPLGRPFQAVFFGEFMNAFSEIQNLEQHELEELAQYALMRFIAHKTNFIFLLQSSVDERELAQALHEMNIAEEVYENINEELMRRVESE